MKLSANWYNHLPNFSPDALKVSGDFIFMKIIDCCFIRFFGLRYKYMEKGGVKCQFYL